MAGPANVWEHKVHQQCLADVAELATYRSVIDGRVDMEFSEGMGAEGGWFYVYDAYNDGDLSGPEDRAYIGVRKQYNKTFDSYEVAGVIKDGKDDKDFEKLYQTGKQRVIRDRVRFILSPITRGVAGFNLSMDGRGNITGVKDPTFDIDDESYPEGMQMIRGAIEMAYKLDASAKSLGVFSRNAFYHDVNSCRNLHKGCEEIERSLSSIMWLQAEDYLDYLTHPCPKDESRQLYLLQSFMEPVPDALQKLNINF